MGAEIGQEAFLGRYKFVTVYDYTDQVLENDDVLRVVPHEDDHTFRVAYDVVTTPPSSQVEFVDDYGNLVRRVKVTTPHTELTVQSSGRFKLLPWQGPYQDVPLGGLEYGEDSAEFVSASPMVKPALLASKAKEIAGDSGSLLVTVGRVIDWVHTNIIYEKGVTSVNTDAAQVLENGRGVCQDKVHLALGFLRALSIPCRYVSCILTQQEGDTHAYLEFLHPKAGWLPADPTKGILIGAGTMYLKLAVGRDYTDASPIKGSFLSRGIGSLTKVFASVEPDKEY